MLEQHIQQQFIDSADLKYQWAQSLTRPIVDATQALLACVTGGGKILICGNGASGALAQYTAALLVGGLERPRPELPALALGTDFGGNLTGMFQQLVAKLGQRQASRGSQQQSFAQPFFEQRNPPRYGRFGQADSLGSTAEAPGFNHPGKDQ